MIRHKLFILIGLLCLLSACKREPMIELSKENQIKIETRKSKEKTAELKNPEQDSENQQAAVQKEETQAQGTSESQNLALDQWQEAKEDTSFSLADFLPFKAFQSKFFKNDQGQTATTYVEFYNEDMQEMQVRWMEQGKVTLKFYQWQEDAILAMGQSSEAKLLTSLLPVSPQVTGQEEGEIILQAPLMKGAKWQASNKHEREIYGLYDFIQLADKQYKDVVLVTYKEDKTSYFEAYAKGQGLVATWQQTQETPTGLGENVQWQDKAENDVMLVIDIPGYRPKANGQGQGNLEETTIPFSFQTNETLDRALDRLFKEEKWIGQEITLMSVNKEEDLAVVDFTSGVVATINANPAGEQAVIAAMVANLGKLLDVKAVRFEVYGNGMLPATMDYPQDGLYSVDLKWFKSGELDGSALATESLDLTP